MSVELPVELVEAIVEGRAALFLGAGASRGAKDNKGVEIPDGKGLAKLIVKRFLGDDYSEYDFRGAYDLAASSRDVLTVQKFLFECLSPFHPADFHLLVPTLPWAGLLTTNYDLIVERAYSKVTSPLQEIITHVKDDDGALDRIDYKSLLYVKMHGCITRHHEIHPPLVASTEQLIAFREGRQGQFDTFLEWAKTKTLIFVVYAFMDSNLRLLFNEVIKEGDKTRIQGIVRDEHGEPKRLNGTIIFTRPSFAFVESESPKMRVFVQMSELEGVDRSDFLIGFPVSFELVFTMRGPTAQNLRLIY
jgi:cold shock CspA family protein